jgi:ubiquinone/menaquinone biosynthesis C-methylase UbiE
LLVYLQFSAGVDFSPAMLAVSRTRVPDEAPVEWYEASAEALPFSNAAFDLGHSHILLA